MKPSLQFRLSPQLALTPQLQQSIRLLLLSTQELHQEVEQMLDDNPFLERDDDADAGGGASAGEAPDSSSTRDDDSADAADDGAGEIGENGEAAPEWSVDADDFDGVRETPLGNAEAFDADTDPLDNRSSDLTLHAHLRAQLGLLRLSEEDALAVGLLIDAINDDGYLTDTLEDIAAGLVDAQSADDELRDDVMARLRCALKWLQSLEPAGVGARDLGDCLTLQLRQGKPSQEQALALLIARHHLDLLAKRDVKKLMAVTGADEDLLKAAQALILSCEPKPGRPFARTDDHALIPDVVVRRAGRGWAVTLNPEVMPRLRINDAFAKAIRGKGGSSGLGAHLQEARWFIKNVLQRFDTILRVSRAIVERQKSFFAHGAVAMKPLVLREIADELGLHESTISRVTSSKYMTCVHGTFELKYFFGSSLSTDAGGNASSTAVRALIKQLVDAEDPCHPLSDGQISDTLKAQGISVARRTVAKYRDAMKIAPTALRKSL